MSRSVGRPPFGLWVSKASRLNADVGRGVVFGSGGSGLGLASANVCVKGFGLVITK